MLPNISKHPTQIEWALRWILRCFTTFFGPTFHHHPHLRSCGRAHHPPRGPADRWRIGHFGRRAQRRIVRRPHPGSGARWRRSTGRCAVDLPEGNDILELEMELRLGKLWIGYDWIAPKFFKNHWTKG